VKPIHIQLSNKRGVVVVLEQLRNQCFREFIFVEDYERIPSVRPSNQFRIFGSIKETVE
jgi:hypothetical protein